MGMAHIKTECDNITKLMLLLIVHVIAKGIFTVVRTLSSKMKGLLKKWPWHTCNKAFTIQTAFTIQIAFTIQTAFQLKKPSSEIQYNIACSLDGCLVLMKMVCKILACISLQKFYKYMYMILDCNIRKIQSCELNQVLVLLGWTFLRACTKGMSKRACKITVAFLN